MIPRSFLFPLFFGLALASPKRFASRQTEDNTVYINSIDDYCLILPRQARTNVGDSEHPGGMKSYCTLPQGNAGTLSADFWQLGKVEMSNDVGGGRSVQLTGCINPETTDRLNADDHGGQYDSHGGANGQGNPANSVCSGYASYIEIVEPSANRACLRCCDDPSDCPLVMDTMGCQEVIPGNYFDCTS